MSFNKTPSSSGDKSHLQQQDLPQLLAGGIAFDEEDLVLKTREEAEKVELADDELLTKDGFDFALDDPNFKIEEEDFESEEEKSEFEGLQPSRVLNDAGDDYNSPEEEEEDEKEREREEAEEAERAKALDEQLAKMRL